MLTSDHADRWAQVLQVLKFDPDHRAAKQAFNKVKSIYKLKSQVRYCHDNATSTQPAVAMTQGMAPSLAAAVHPTLHLCILCCWTAGGVS